MWYSSYNHIKENTMTKIYILTIEYSDLVSGEFGLLSYAFSTKEKAEEARKKDIENWKKAKEIVTSNLKWTQDTKYLLYGSQIIYYVPEQYDDFHVTWSIEEKKIDGNLENW